MARMKTHEEMVAEATRRADAAFAAAVERGKARAAAENMKAGDSVRRKTGHTVGVIVAIYPEVKYGYNAHSTMAKVRWPTPERRRGDGYQHSTLNVANLVKA